MQRLSWSRVATPREAGAGSGVPSLLPCNEAGDKMELGSKWEQDFGL